MRSFRPNREAARSDRRDRLRRERLAAPLLRVLYPQVSQLRLQLNFDDGTASPPATQAHILHPPAPAFFQFPCPFADCSGRFDLGAPVAEMLAAARHETAHRLACLGERAQHRPCGLQLQCAIGVQYERDLAA